jgi:hypothetical protein
MNPPCRRSRTIRREAFARALRRPRAGFCGGVRHTPMDRSRLVHRVWRPARRTAVRPSIILTGSAGRPGFRWRRRSVVVNDDRFPTGLDSDCRFMSASMTAPARRELVEAVHLRWPGSLPGRVQVNAQERVRHESVQTDWSHAPAGPRPGLAARAASGRPRRGRRRGLTALSPPRRPRIVLESSRKDPASFPEGSRKDPARIRRGLGASGTPRSGRSAGSPPGAPAHRPARRPRQGRRLGLTALPPPRRPRTVLQGSGQRPRRIRPPSPTARTMPTPPGPP